ncbi:MAG: hypothetical protein GWN58_22855 [Anaerolineae bacterium]|nr:hypothetical protein [Thermoplasmata archaeon]NIV32215.1 hypothetical protein [Anaerolineae bacterium]NIY03667.1 hypothetical protein [Thermoplasmata archaeon]
MTEKLPAVQGEGEPAMVPDSMVVLAQNPVQMREAQAQMVAWAKGKVAKAQQEVAELEENLAIAKKRKWRQSTLKAAITRARRRVEFYYKTQLALEEGYCLVPNFPTGVFAIRTTRREPKKQDLKRWPGQVHDEESTRPPAGEGRYVDAEIAAVAVEGPDQNGETKEFWTADDEYTEEIPFPFTFVKPQIMEATSRAMAHKIFDDIGCLPKRRARRNVDPIIVGRIIHKEGTYQERVFTFLIAWFMDLEQM